LPGVLKSVFKVENEQPLPPWAMKSKKSATSFHLGFECKTFTASFDGKAASAIRLLNQPVL
jgi:hypothetical protein